MTPGAPIGETSAIRNGSLRLVFMDPPEIGPMSCDCTIWASGRSMSDGVSNGEQSLRVPHRSHPYNLARHGVRPRRTSEETLQNLSKPRLISRVAFPYG